MRYFAYGSNLLTRRLTDPLRAPSAVARGIATVSGCVMRFHKIGTDGSGKCTLIGTGDDADVVYGVLYEFAATDLAGRGTPATLMTTNSRISARFLRQTGGTTHPSRLHEEYPFLA